MEEPRKYTGYDSAGNVKVGPITAQNANNDINPQEVATAVNNIKETFETEFSNLAEKLSEVDVTDTIEINGQNMSRTIEAAATMFNECGTSLTEGIEDFITNAETTHDNLQRQYNQAAHDKCANTSGVAEVR